MRFDNPQVCWNAVAGADHHDIAGNQRRGRNGFMIPLTNHHRFAGEHIANALERFFGVTLLNMTNQGVDHRHAEDHQSIDPVAHHRRQ